jgi:two-component system, OmpR family, KDP operon response regulator KdpE
VSAAPPAGRVLVCDDELQILRALKVVLREAGFEVEAVATGQGTLDAAAVRPPDAAIVDLMLPDGDGVEVCRQLREWSAMPILVLSALGDEDQKVRALEAGADDYVTKPFGPRELVARLRAVLRRAGARADDEPLIAVDGLELDLAAHVVRRDRQEVHLTPIEYGLLRVLALNRGRLLTHRTLLRGAALRRRHAHVAHPHRQPAAQGRAGGGGPALHPDRPRRRVPVRRVTALRASPRA